MISPLLEREKINLELPMFTLDVNQVALKEPTLWSSEMQGLAPLEWNYFWVSSVELCVTPETTFEITKGQTITSLPYAAYQRFKKTEFFKSRPAGVTLKMSEQQANQLWSGIKNILWPTVHDTLNQRQLSDVNQLYYHTVSSGSACDNSAFLILDNHFISNRNLLNSELGVTVLTPSEAWEHYRPKYSLYMPSQREIRWVFESQQNYLINLSNQAETIL